MLIIVLTKIIILLIIKIITTIIIMIILIIIIIIIIIITIIKIIIIIMIITIIKAIIIIIMITIIIIMRYSWYKVKDEFSHTRCKQKLKHTVPSVECFKFSQNFKIVPFFVSAVHWRPQALL